MAITKINTPELFDFSATNTALQLPTGDTASRPTSPSTGEWRFNSELKYVEYYDGADWFQIDTEANTLVGSENFNVNTYFGNGATQVIDAKFNEAANFNGSSSYIDTNIPASFFNTSTWSISLWIKPTNTNFKYFLGNTNSGILNGFAMGMYGDGSRFDFITRSGSTTVGRFQGGAPIADVWTNIVIINNNNSFSFYQDNALMTNYGSYTQPVSGGSYTSSLDFVLGRAGFYTAELYAGSIDQVRIFNTALTAAQAEDLYTDETTTTASTLNFPAGAVCIAAYQLDGNGDDISTNYNGTTTDIGYTGLEFQPDFVWIKRRDNAIGNTNNLLFDSVRGAGKRLISNVTNAESTETDELTSFNSNGFTVGADASTNGSGGSIVAWNWKAGGAAVSNTDGSITSQVSANTAAGFSIVSYTGNSTTGATVGHGLSEVPEMIIVKRLQTPVDNWAVYNATIGNSYRLSLDETGGKSGPNRLEWNNTTPTTSVITLGNHSSVNTNSTYIAYAFHSVAGYSKIGSYAGNGNSTGPVVDTGFEPAWVMIKSSSSDDGGGGAWIIYDNKRSTSNPRDKRLYANYNYEELTSSSYNLDFLTASPKGFQPKVAASSYGFNTLGVEYIYMAFAAT